MADSILPAHWSALRSVKPQSENTLALASIDIGDTPTGMHAAMDQSGLLHVLIPVREGPKSPQPSDLNGLKVRHRVLESGEVLDLCAPPSHEQIFTPFCNEVVQAVFAQGRDPWKAVATIIRAWRSAWDSPRQAMTKNVQVGLFGELLVLRTLMIPALGPRAVDIWSGPQYERHDFCFNQLHIEVKTTRKVSPTHTISRYDQLRAPPGGQLLFVSVQLEESIDGTGSLASEIDCIIDTLRIDTGALDLFMAKLARIGWSEELRNSGELLRFYVRDAVVFQVDEEFPRLPDDFEPPDGVTALEYTIDLANLPSLGLGEVSAILASFDDT